MRARLSPDTKADITGPGVMEFSQDLRTVTVIDVKPSQDLRSVKSYNHLPKSDDRRPELPLCVAVNSGMASGRDERNDANQKQRTSESD